MTASESEVCTLDEESLQQLYTWIDEIPLSRPKKNITRDFSDGVLIAEIIHHFAPKLVDLHNYTTASSSTTKLDNWNLLSRKVFIKLNFTLDENLVKGVVSCKSGVVELVLQNLRQNIESYLARKKAAALVEKQKYHDHLSGEGMKSQVADTFPEGSNYGFGIYDPSQVNHDPNLVSYHYQYQSQPLALIGDPSSTSSLPVAVNSVPLEVESGSKSSSDVGGHKPVTHASKMKVKQLQQQPSKLVSPANDNSHSTLRIALEEKEQALLASQETVQILQAKIRRLEHLLHLKDLRISEMRNQHQNGTSSMGNMHLPKQNSIPLTQQSSLGQDSNLQHNFAGHPPQGPHGYNNFVPHPPLPQIPRPAPGDLGKLPR